MNDARAKRPPPGPPPIIGYLREQGVTHLRVSCNGVNCHHGADLALGELGLPDDTPFPLVATPAPVGVPALRITEGQRHAEVAVWVALTLH